MRIILLLVFVFVIQNVNTRASSMVGKFYNTVTNITGNLMMRGRKLVPKISTSLGKLATDLSVHLPKINNEQCLFKAKSKNKVLYDEVLSARSLVMTTPQLIAMNGYPAESHTVMTDDGYLLTLHRIPTSKYCQTPRKTVLLYHGLSGSSSDWVLAGPQKGLAYILSDAGYDVWLANVRGNLYSRAHVSRPVDSFEFWNFTWHEVSQHDLPSIIDYMKQVKGWDVKINYIGHSMGTTVLFALLSTKPEYNERLNAGFALAPVAYMSEIKSPFKVLAPYAYEISYLMKLFGSKEFSLPNSLIRWLSGYVCKYKKTICDNSAFLLYGLDPGQIDSSLLPIILGHFPAAVSTKSLVHYAQEMNNKGRFQQYDYGHGGNMRQYENAKPPEYPLHKITLPIALLSAENDWLAGNADVRKLYSKLSNPIEHYVVPDKEFNHLNFLWAMDAPKLVYQKLLKLLREADEN